MNIKENSLVIVRDKEKTKFLKNFRKDKNLFNISVMGLKEFVRRFYFDYTNEAIYFIHKKYDVIKSLAEIYISNLIYIRNIDEPKIEFLKTIKEDLDKNSLLKYDNYFKKSLKDKNIVLYDLKHLDNFYENIFNDLKEYASITKINDPEKAITKKSIYRLPDKETEVAFVAGEIVKLIQKGIDINKIFLANVNDDYHFSIYNTFKDFNIPIELPSKESIESTVLVKKFKEFYSSDISNTMENLKEYIHDKKDQTIYKNIIDLVNSYNWCNDYLEVKDFLFEDLNQIKIPSTKLKNAVRIVDFPGEIIESDCYLFLLNFNQGVIPVNKKDEDYLNDQIKVKLGMSNSIDINKKSILDLQEAISNTNNIVVTYRARDLSGELYISNAYTEELFEEKYYSINYHASNSYNKKILVREKDQFKKYGTTSTLLKTLNNTYETENYLDYKNSFKGIDKNKLKNYLNPKLTLSYSSMNTFYKCSFRYYLENILKINKFDDTFEITIGNIFHNILSIAFEQDFDFEKSWNKTLEGCEYEFNTSEKFFLTILKPELEFIIDTINKQNNLTSLKKTLYEQRIEIKIDEKNNVLFKGFVDKILYDEIDGEKIVAIIDYKTGNPELNLDNSIYGLDMQLPIYAYLIKNYEPLKDARIGGFYLQKILNNKKTPKDKIESLKLQGYSNSDQKILSAVDNTFQNSELIKSMKMTTKGLSSYAKVLSDDEIEKLSKLVYKKIYEASQKILNGEFNIDPKEINTKLEGCKFCKYKDVCYMKNDDIVKLKSVSRKEFLGGDEHAFMD